MPISINTQARLRAIIPPIQTSYGLSEDCITYFVFKVIIPQTYDACRKWVLEIASGSGSETETETETETESIMDAIHDVLIGVFNGEEMVKMMVLFERWVAYNLWAHFFCRYIHEPQFGEMENMDPEYCVFLKDHMQQFGLEVSNGRLEAEDVKGERVDMDETHQEGEPQEKGMSRAEED